ncbi:MAG: dethiobiotin synthase [Paludibacterium sp.]|uniref:dethiobiotin synthase n=1 Tax=Paludibacterium sp. TaxID=1917523 RepID=UPI0025EB4EE1|nr:dethiobiotin synthase [Paludibacterium sp.]MBV8045813.1 dethiobiotin synthase [Paludibacterium sp.]MBV8647084.1 dethiobiotin synthase [Paludibacterium sp.]
MLQSQGYFITGTDTEIGKTYSTVKLLRQWQGEGLRAGAMKPVASGCEVDEAGHWLNDDVCRLVAVTGQTDLDLMNPYRFLPPISPHIAAAQAGIEIKLETIVEHYQRLAPQYDRVAVEGAGGWFAPLSGDHFMADLAAALGLPVILVVGMRLGCINHALLTAQAIRAAGCEFAGWVANQVVPRMPAYEDNLATLDRHLGAPRLLTLPYAP